MGAAFASLQESYTTDILIRGLPGDASLHVLQGKVQQQLMIGTWTVPLLGVVSGGVPLSRGMFWEDAFSKYLL